MIIVLDTNVIHEDFLMKSGRFAILRDYLQKTQSKVILPKIVYDELEATYERHLSMLVNCFIRAKGSLAAVLSQTQLPDINVSIMKEVASYMTYMKNTLGVEDADIFDYKESYLHDVIERAIHRKRPCTDRGEEIRDAVLWQCVLDIANDAPDKTLVFISENKKQFTLGADTLHPELLEDCSKRGVIVKYFKSLDEFAKEHASTIDFITNKWLLESIDGDKILKKASNSIEYYAKLILERKFLDFQHVGEKSSTGYFNIIHGSLDIVNFYVYEMSDGSFRVEAKLTGEVEVECEVEMIDIKKEYDYDYGYAFTSDDYDYTPVIRKRREFMTDFIYVYPEVSLNLELIIRDKAVISWEVVS